MFGPGVISTMSDVRTNATSGESNGGSMIRSISIRSSRDALPYLLAGLGRMIRGVLEFMIAARQVHYLNAVGIQAAVVNQTFRQHQRFRHAVAA
jgi:hypothetical protein